MKYFKNYKDERKKELISLMKIDEATNRGIVYSLQDTYIYHTDPDYVENWIAYIKASPLYNVEEVTMLEFHEEFRKHQFNI